MDKIRQQWAQNGQKWANVYKSVQKVAIVDKNGHNWAYKGKSGPRVGKNWAKLGRSGQKMGTEWAKVDKKVN